MIERVPFDLFPYNVHPEPAMLLYSRNAFLNVKTVKDQQAPEMVKFT